MASKWSVRSGQGMVSENDSKYTAGGDSNVTPEAMCLRLIQRLTLTSA